MQAEEREHARSRARAEAKMVANAACGASRFIHEDLERRYLTLCLRSRDPAECDGCDLSRRCAETAAWMSARWSQPVPANEPDYVDTRISRD
ncbi:hypothetical protein FHS31_002946 [Sphingomonas vulcanisoli]|uniref:4Fe-4S Wbl-type domain-containing protein n=1 Tax=Sphingomonas vulcanisoli TaxID=1658060 RepID=A0ABX0TX68_9SPHN|nr:hypothetical protein [Sphingomonas vulcanisoli]NIJ09314.1 hypothetical protein [Sphingomonas vulcanisoli]